MGSITPAYGRDYKTSEAAFADWISGKDFMYHNAASPWHGKYCSERDFNDRDSLKLRYDRNRELIVIIKENGTWRRHEVPS